MEGFTRPYNNINEDVVRKEHEQLYTQARAWAHAHVMMPGTGVDSETRLAYRAEITSAGRKNLIYINLNVTDYNDLKRVYKYVYKIAYSLTYKNIRYKVIYYARLEKTVP